ncbi:hypothetical protein ACFFJY_03170 [Fictibacillus aquaticus]|uniref:RCK N-terminal domain-containing protein n=1 Tax=Fictibacillus aquaticus TaxID=2021314 RepID=A0A235F8U7_9BACL|nr:toprim domain-containing protein [Fictibacillus aquaticus]OYD57698.1 hypothetical protein CGZ90_13625 [Fictibacillus aquaticus]
MPKLKIERFASSIYLILLAAAAVLTFYFSYFNKPLFFIISGLTIVMAFFHSKLYRHAVQVYTFSLAIMSGLYGFLTAPYLDYPFPNALYSTVRLFVFDTDQVFTKEATKFIDYPPSIELARWCAVIYVSATISQLLMKAFGHSFQLQKMRWFGSHVVILGLNDKSATLAKNLLVNQRKVLIVSEENERMPDEEELVKSGAVILRMKLLSESAFKKSAIHKSKYIIAFHDQDGYNLDLVKAIDEYVKKTESHGERKIPVYIQQNHTITQHLYDKIKVSALEIHAVSLQSLVARQLLNEHPVYEHYESEARDYNGKPFHLLLIGFGHTGQQIAIEAIQRSHFFRQQKLHLTVIDQQAERLEREWRDAFPRLDDAAMLHFIQHDIKSANIIHQIREAVPQITHIYISLDNDEEDVLQALRLHQQFKNLPIYIKIQRDGHFTDWLHNTSEFSHLKRFGSWENVLTEEIVIRENLDELAKSVHEAYEDKAAKETLDYQKTPWEKLSFFQKNSNRAQVDHLDTKLFLLGLERAQEDDEPMSQEDFDKFLTQQKLNNVARAEHLRWNAFHYMNGWDTLPLEDVTNKIHKDNSRKLHACLVTWDELVPVSSRRGIDFQESDRNPVRQVFELTAIKKAEQ